MIKASELRIGNWIQRKGTQEPPQWKNVFIKVLIPLCHVSIFNLLANF